MVERTGSECHLHISGAHFEMPIPRSTDRSRINEKEPGASPCMYLHVLYCTSQVKFLLRTTFAKSFYQVTAQQKGNFNQDFAYQIFQNFVLHGKLTYIRISLPQSVILRKISLWASRFYDQQSKGWSSNSLRACVVGIRKFWKSHTYLTLIPTDTILVKLQKAEIADYVFSDPVQKPAQTSSSSHHGLEPTAATHSARQKESTVCSGVKSFSLAIITNTQNTTIQANTSISFLAHSRVTYPNLLSISPLLSRMSLFLLSQSLQAHSPT